MESLFDSLQTQFINIQKSIISIFLQKSCGRKSVINMKKNYRKRATIHKQGRNTIRKSNKFQKKEKNILKNICNLWGLSGWMDIRCSLLNTFRKKGKKKNFKPNNWRSNNHNAQVKNLKIMIRRQNLKIKGKNLKNKLWKKRDKWI